MLSDAEIKRFTPHNGHVLVRLNTNPTGEVSAGGIIMPLKEHEDRIMRRGFVAALGDGIPLPKRKDLYPHYLKVGDQVMVDNLCGTVVHRNEAKGVEHRVMSVYPYDQIAGVVEGDCATDFFDA